MILSYMASVLIAGTQNYTWRDIVQANFRDISFVGRAVSANRNELRKISTDFEASYRFLGSEVQAELKEPFMLRMDSKVEDTDVQYIENGSRRVFRIPRSRLSKIEDVAGAPGKRQTPLDFGLLTTSMFDSLFEATFVRTDRETGDLIFDLTYKRPEYHDTSRHRVWVDPVKRYVTKRVWFAQDGHEMATFLYQAPRLQNGVWFPSKAIVKNVDDAVAGVTEYTKVIVNSGMSDRAFGF
jgi:hypothetical protein